MGQTGHGNWISSAEGLMLTRLDCSEVSFTGGAGCWLANSSGVLLTLAPEAT